MATATATAGAGDDGEGDGTTRRGARRSNARRAVWAGKKKRGEHEESKSEEKYNTFRACAVPIV